MARIGFYGGCFNPPTKAHIELAKIARKQCKLDKVIFVPIGDLYEKEKLEKGIHRYNMLKIACKNQEKIEVSDIEINNPKLYKAIDIFEKIKEIYQEDEIYFLMGADNLERLPSWKDSEKLIKEFNYIVFDRGEIKTKTIIEKNEFFKKHEKQIIGIENTKFKNCSSTQIRQKIKTGKKPRYLEENIYLYIKNNNIYQ